MYCSACSVRHCGYDEIGCWQYWHVTVPFPALWGCRDGVFFKLIRTNEKDVTPEIRVSQRHQTVKTQSQLNELLTARPWQAVSRITGDRSLIISDKAPQQITAQIAILRASQRLNAPKGAPAPVFISRPGGLAGRIVHLIGAANSLPRELALGLPSVSALI